MDHFLFNSNFVFFSTDVPKGAEAPKSQLESVSSRRALYNKAKKTIDALKASGKRDAAKKVEAAYKAAVLAEGKLSGGGAGSRKQVSNAVNGLRAALNPTPVKTRDQRVEDEAHRRSMGLPGIGDDARLILAAGQGYTAYEEEQDTQSRTKIVREARDHKKTGKKKQEEKEKQGRIRERMIKALAGDLQPQVEQLARKSILSKENIKGRLEYELMVKMKNFSPEELHLLNGASFGSVVENWRGGSVFYSWNVKINAGRPSVSVKKMGSGPGVAGEIHIDNPDELPEDHSMEYLIGQANARLVYGVRHWLNTPEGDWKNISNDYLGDFWRNCTPGDRKRMNGLVVRYTVGVPYENGTTVVETFRAVFSESGYKVEKLKNYRPETFEKERKKLEDRVLSVEGKASILKESNDEFLKDQATTLEEDSLKLKWMIFGAVRDEIMRDNKVKPELLAKISDLEKRLADLTKHNKALERKDEKSKTPKKTVPKTTSRRVARPAVKSPKAAEKTPKVQKEVLIQADLVHLINTAFNKAGGNSSKNPATKAKFQVELNKLLQKYDAKNVTASNHGINVNIDANGRVMVGGSRVGFNERDAGNTRTA